MLDVSLGRDARTQWFETLTNIKKSEFFTHELCLHFVGLE